MTMFSMKPRFDLAAFLASPAPTGAARAAWARRRGGQFSQSAAPEETSGTTPSEDADTKD